MRLLAQPSGTLDWMDTNMPADQADQITASKIAFV